MTFRGFTDNSVNIGTPNNINIAEKPLKQERIKPNRVDINVLKAKLQESENKEFKKNLVVLSTLILGLGVLGIYLSL